MLDVNAHIHSIEEQDIIILLVSHVEKLNPKKEEKPLRGGQDLHHINMTEDLKKYLETLKKQNSPINQDYIKAVELGLTGKDRWSEGIPHHPMSERLMKFLVEHDFIDYNDYFCWKMGGDGDNGETLMYQMDAFFETLDHEKKEHL